MCSVVSRLSVGVLAVAVTLLAVTPSALASNARMGGGTVQLGPPTLVSEKTVGKVLIRTQEGSLTFTGTIAGTGTIDVVAHVSPVGKETFDGNWTAPVILNGSSGTLELTFHGRDNGTFSGTFIARGAGALAGLVGQGRFSGQDATGAGTYTFHYNM